MKDIVFKYHANKLESIVQTAKAQRQQQQVTQQQVEVRIVGCK